ncbi:glycosyltransferase family 4 protein [Agromyces lapidis]|uniref:D-inositol 3-phosphate glycosyltransferase n=1 Tax=Agromyces lapidis TaxID=279574 RepID=A0ABV5SM49_9MICO|nr:glycosyltransferase family 4 protein [Agromyces lapidis]
MRIVICPHSLELGGSQRNAIDLATAFVRRGHDVTVFGPDGELVEVLEARGIPFVEAPRPRIRPSYAVMDALCELVDHSFADLVHAFEWPPITEAVYGPYARRRIPVVGTVMSMSVAPFIPDRLPLTVGTRHLLETESGVRRRLHLLEPPIDTAHDRPRDVREARASLSIPDGELVLVIVARLVRELKLEGILSAIAAVGVLGRERPVRLVVAGDGPESEEVTAAAAAQNDRLGRRAVVLLGNVPDPRQVYAAADVVLGMGGSALRGMAFAKPVVVQGELGFWRTLTPESVDGFLVDGWYGRGEGDDGVGALLGELGPLLASAATRRELGEFSRSVVERHYSLDAAADRMEELYVDAIVRGPEIARWRLLRPYLAVTAYDLDRKVRRRFGAGVARDDFNARPAIRAAREVAP